MELRGLAFPFLFEHNEKGQGGWVFSGKGDHRAPALHRRFWVGREAARGGRDGRLSPSGPGPIPPSLHL